MARATTWCPSRRSTRPKYHRSLPLPKLGIEVSFGWTTETWTTGRAAIPPEHHLLFARDSGQPARQLAGHPRGGQTWAHEGGLSPLNVYPPCRALPAAADRARRYIVVHSHKYPRRARSPPIAVSSSTAALRLSARTLRSPRLTEAPDPSSPLGLNMGGPRPGRVRREAAGAGLRDTGGAKSPRRGPFLILQARDAYSSSHRAARGQRAGAGRVAGAGADEVAAVYYPGPCPPALVRAGRKYLPKGPARSVSVDLHAARRPPGRSCDGTDLCHPAVHIATVRSF